MGPATCLTGVTLAVLAVVVVHLVSQSIRANLDEPRIAGHTHVVTGETLTESAYFELRRRWRRSGTDFEDPAATVSGDRTWARSVLAMFPVVEGFVDIRGEPRRVLGFDPVAAGNIRSLSEYEASAPATPQDSTPDNTDGYGRFITDDVIMVSPETARDIAADGGTIAGLPIDTIDAPTQVALADLPTAQRLLGRGGEVDAIWLRVAGVRTRFLDWLDSVLPGIGASLPEYADPEIGGYTVTAAARWNPSRRFADAILFNLGMLSLLCLVMAAFIAFQASESNAARRRLEQERLIAIGASRWTLRWMVCAEGLVIGVLGAAAGLALGSLVADALLQAATDTATTDADTDAMGYGVALDAWVVGKAIACGVVVSALGPMAEGRFSPSTRIRGVMGLLAAAVAVVGLVDGSLGWAFGALAAVCAVQVVIVVPLAGWTAGRLSRLGRSLAMRSNLRATALRSSEIRLALGALSVAAAVAIGMGVMVESLRRDFTDMLDVRLADGVYLETASDIREADLDAIRHLAGVRDVRLYGDGVARSDDGPVTIRIARLDATEAGRYGFDAALETRGMVNEVGARLMGIGDGDVLDLVSAGRRVRVEIAHVFRDFGAASPRVILPMTFVSQLDADSVRWRRVSVWPDADATESLTAQLGERYGAGRVRNHAQIRDLAVAVFDRTFVVSRSLAVMALLVAAIGLYAALTSLQASRAREFRLLSAVGHTRAELMRLALSQTTVLGAVALLAALPLGLTMAWILCDFVNPAAFGWSIGLHLDFRSIAGPLLLGALAACAAGAVPAYRVAFRGLP